MGIFGCQEEVSCCVVGLAYPRMPVRLTTSPHNATTTLYPHPTLPNRLRAIVSNPRGFSEVQKKMKSEAFEMEVTPLWVKEFPFVGKIIGTERLKGKYGEDCRLHLKGESLSTFAFDAWGENKNFLINTLGSNTGNWVGAVIRIVKDGDARRIVEAKA